jgi:hypothetical protein
MFGGGSPVNVMKRHFKAAIPAKAAILHLWG